MEAAIKWFMVFMILTAGDISTQIITKLNKGIISQYLSLVMRRNDGTEQPAHTSTQALNKLLKQNQGPICVPPYCTVLPGVSAMPALKHTLCWDLKLLHAQFYLYRDNLNRGNHRGRDLNILPLMHLIYVRVITTHSICSGIITCATSRLRMLAGYNALELMPSSQSMRLATLDLETFMSKSYVLIVR
ncbi:Uncharacterized protein HZ326_4479 [Fusarium oxysporum f. sp. albedinis]|nr:Uncharacterized protein HZ326_4479 [Fusarium oxysporum f. sp. albedinis]